MERKSPKEAGEMRARMKSVLADTSGMDSSMVSTLRKEMGRGERIRLLTKGPTENTARWQTGLKRFVGKLTGKGKK